MKKYTEFLSEGFLSWISSMLKSLFSDNTSEETKSYANDSLKQIKYINSELIEPTEDIISEKDPMKFLNLFSKYKTELLNKKIITSEEGIKWELLLLSIKIRIASDNKDTKTVKKLKTVFDKLTKKPEVKKITKEILQKLNKK